jgi:Flp pilus assembly protein protease CpaA
MSIAVELPRALFVLLLLAGMGFDIQQRRVPNWLVLALIVVSVAGVLLGAAPARTMTDALVGGAVGLAMWVPFWLLGLLGAGDVKYFAAACCWLGVSLGWRCALAAAVMGGVMSLVVLIAQRGVTPALRFLGFTVAHLRETVQAADVSAVANTARTFPYAVPMGIALIGATLSPAWFFGGVLP